MKKIVFYCFLAMAAISACKKDAKDNTPPTTKPDNPASVNAAVTALKKVDSLSTFAAILTDMDLSKDGLEQVTVFAAPDRAIANYNPNGRQAETPKPGIPDSVIRKHLVKGLIKFADLTDGKTLTTLGGQTLTIMSKEGRIWINGVEILHADSATTNFVVYTIQRLLSAVATNSTVTIDVYNTLKWTTAKPAGEPQAGAQVKLYRTREDFQNNANPAYTRETNANGQAVFPNIPGGNYYVVAEMEGLSNLLGATKQQDGTVIGYLSTDSLYQAMPEASEMPLDRNAAPGNFRLADVNSDGIIDDKDRVLLPAQDITVVTGVAAHKRILIGTANNSQLRPFNTAEQVNSALSACYAAFSQWHELQTTIDAIYTDDADCTNLPDWCAFNNYAITPTTNQVAAFWKNGFTLITNLNRILQQAGGVNMDTKLRDAAIGEAKAMKGYVYLQLINYFGEVPLHDDLTIIPTNIARKDVATCYTYAKELLVSANQLLAGSAVSKTRFSANATKALLARLALQTQKPVDVIEYTNALINSSQFKLEESNLIFSKVDNNELILCSYNKLLTPPITTLFTSKGSFVPEIRYAEIYLMQAEAKIQQGEITTAVTLLNTLRFRNNTTRIEGMPTQQQMRSYLLDDWKANMKNEGFRFASLSRLDMLQNVLAPAGYTQKNKYLPVPMYFLIDYPNITQNPGY
jgi:uncharacterized surface protein with fasciclin (FAS1) repeats